MLVDESVLYTSTSGASATTFTVSATWAAGMASRSAQARRTTPRDRSEAVGCVIMSDSPKDRTGGRDDIPNDRIVSWRTIQNDRPVCQPAAPASQRAFEISLAGTPSTPVNPSRAPAPCLFRWNDATLELLLVV